MVEILDYAVAEDCGTMINPMIVDGQILGGIAQGIGTALYEEIPFDEQGQPLATTFGDYMVPCAPEIPMIRIAHAVSPARATEYGVKGLGEGGAIAPPATIGNALADAFRIDRRELQRDSADAAPRVRRGGAGAPAERRRMKAAPFDYVRPSTVAEASAALSRDGVTTAAIAGGQSLVPMLALRVALIDLLVDLGRLDALKETAETSETVRIGALTTHAAIEDGEVPDRFGGLLRHVAGQISYRAVRHHGTIGGSVALADPAADWPPCLMALGATVRITGPNGTRSEPVADFILDAYSTSLASGEIILGFDVPRPETPPRWGFAKVARKSGAFANSIAIAVAGVPSRRATVVLGAAASRACLLSNVAERVAAGADEDALRSAIATDLAAHVPDADAYQSDCTRRPSCAPSVTCGVE